MLDPLLKKNISIKQTFERRCFPVNFSKFLELIRTTASVKIKRPNKVTESHFSEDGVRLCDVNVWKIIQDFLAGKCFIQKAIVRY